MKILVVDSDPAARDATVACLREAYPGAELVATGDGMEAVQYSLRAPVDAVYTEVLMPRISGFDVARLVRKFRPGAAAYLVSAAEDYVDGARARGLSGYFLKPLTREALARGDLLARGQPIRYGI